MLLFRAHRSVARHLLFALTAIFLAVAAVDVMWVHRVSGPPEIDDATQLLTTRGLSQQRTDFMWGTFFLVGSGVLAGIAVVGLTTRRPVVEMDEAGLRLRVAGPRGYIEIPWSNVRWVHSSADGDDELIPARVLLINVNDASSYPAELWGAQWDDKTVMVDADSWNATPEEVVTHAQRALDAWRRDNEPPAPDEPTVTRSTVGTPPADPGGGEPSEGSEAADETAEPAGVATDETLPTATQISLLDAGLEALSLPDEDEL